VIQEMRTGGAERVVVSLARGAGEAGHAVAIASGPGELLGEFDGKHYPLPMLDRRPWRIAPATWKLDHALRDWHPDLVHCHNPGMAAVTALATARGRRGAALVSVHGVPEADWAATARILKLAGLPVVACGPGVREALSEHGVEALTMVANGVSPPPPPVSREDFERKLGLPAGRRLLVSVGRLVEAKNHSLAIRSLRSIPDATLVVAGEGPLRGRLELTAAEEGVAGRVVLAGLRSDARELIGAADVVIASSRSEGLSMAILEALAAGRPLVATAVRGMREILVDGRVALLVPEDDPDALAAAVCRLLDDPAFAAELGARGRKLAQRYTEGAMISEYLSLYGQLAAR
jgi:glycosyltransferase involved in cell wall biosynthesis